MRRTGSGPAVANLHGNLRNHDENTTDDFADRSESYRGAKILVFGATGFIGRWTARKLTQLGSDLYLPARDLSAARGIFAVYGIRGSVCELDLLDTQAVGELIDRIRPAVIFDLAGYGIDRNEDREDIAYLVNARLPEVLCSAMPGGVDWSGQRIVRAGSAMEYGAASGDLEERTEPLPTTTYGRSKLAGTLNLARACRQVGLKGLTARLFSVYGAGEHPGRLLPTLVRARESREPIKLTAGRHHRDFIYVEDVVEGLVRLGLASAAEADVVNLATGKLTPVRDFTETAADELAISRDRLDFGALPTRPEEMRHEPTSIVRLAKLTGWRPETTIAEGIRKTLAFF